MRAPALRAAACKGWRYMPGMRVFWRGETEGQWDTRSPNDPYRVLAVAPGRLLLVEADPIGDLIEPPTWEPIDSVEPDLGDRGVLGQFLGLVQDAWGHGAIGRARDRDVSIERIAAGYSLAVRVFDETGAWVYDGAVHGGWMAGEVARPHGGVTSMDARTYAEALVNALEGAP